MDVHLSLYLVCRCEIFSSCLLGLFSKSLPTLLLNIPITLQEGAKLSDEDNGIGRWIRKQQNNPRSPLYGWSKGDMRDAIDRLRRTSEQASSTSDYPLCLADVPDWLMVILKAVIPMLLTSSLILVGENSVGKTTLAMVLGMAFSRWHIRSSGSASLPSVRVTQDLDFLKAKAGSPEEPVIEDDGDVWGLRPTQLKALLDVVVQNPMVRARYTAAKFSAGQLRVVCDNSYDKDVAESVSDGALDMDTLWKLIAPAFHPEVRGAHIGAILKRACVMMNTNKHVIVKLANRPEVMAYPIVKGTMYVKHSCLQVLQAFFQDDEPRTGFQDILAQENTIMRELLGSRINKTDIHLPAVKDVQVVAPPLFMGMSWHEVRTYVEAGISRGATDPYPVGHPEHLKWTSVVLQKQSDESLAAILQEAEFAADSHLGEASGVRDSPAFDDIGKDEFQDSQRDMPDSQDSFWKPLIKHEPEDDDHAVIAPGAATSSAAPPSYLLLPVPEAQYVSMRMIILRVSMMRA